MARRTPTTGRAGARGAQAEGAAEDAGTAAPAAGSGKGLTFYDALILATTALLLAAFLMVDHLQGTLYGGGMFFS